MKKMQKSLENREKRRRLDEIMAIDFLKFMINNLGVNTISGQKVIIQRCGR